MPTFTVAAVALSPLSMHRQLALFLRHRELVEACRQFHPHDVPPPATRTLPDMLAACLSLITAHNKHHPFQYVR
jgi:hypothetical protein